MVDSEELKEKVISLSHHVIGNGGKGLIPRMDEAEKDIEVLETNKVDKLDCRRNRVEDYQNVEKEFKALKTALDELKKSRVDDKKLTIMVLGILASSLFSAASLAATVFIK